MKSITIVLCILFALTLITCASVKSNGKHPFKIVSATCSTDADPVVNIACTTTEDVVFKTVFFKNKQGKLKAETQNDQIVLSTTLKKSNLFSKIVLDKDPAKEFGNTIPPTSESLPFKLKDNEAALSYELNDEVHYYVIKNLKKTP